MLSFHPLLEILPTGRPKASQWQRGILAAAALVIIQPLRLTLVAGFPVDRGSTPPSEAQNEIMLQSHTVVSIRFWKVGVIEGNTPHQIFSKDVRYGNTTAPIARFRKFADVDKNTFVAAWRSSKLSFSASLGPCRRWLGSGRLYSVAP